MSHELTPADIGAVIGNTDRNNMNDLWNNPFIYLVWLAVLGGGNGIFGNRGYGAEQMYQNALTRSDLFEGFNNQEINGQLRGITNGLCDGFYALNSGLKDGFYANMGAIRDGFYATQGAIAENRFASQQCCQNKLVAA